MTIACAVIDRKTGEVAIGADTEWTSPFRVHGEPKLVVNGAWAAAAAGAGWSVRMLRECLPKLANLDHTADEALELAPRRLMKHLHRWSRKHGHGSADEGHWSAPWSVLLACPRGVWKLAGDGTILHAHGGYLAIDSGAEVASGALYATRTEISESGSCLKPSVRIARAIYAAIEHAQGCGGTATIHTFEGAPRS